MNKLQQKWDVIAPQLEIFFKVLKERLDNGIKKNDKKEITFLIEGGDDSLSGINFKTYTIKSEDYNKIVSNEPYVSEALAMFTLTVNANSIADAGTLQILFETMAPMLEELPFIKPFLQNGEYHLRVNGSKLSLDFVIKNQAMLKSALDLGIDLADYNEIKLCLGTAFTFSDFFTLSIDQLLEKIFSFHFSLNQNLINLSYLFKAIIAALETLSFTDQSIQKIIINTLISLKSFSKFLSARFALKYGPKEAVDFALKSPILSDFGGKDEIAQQLETYKIMSEQMGKEMVRGFLESMGMIDAAKAVNVDTILLAFTFPKYQSGVAEEINLPGLTSVFNDKFMN